MLEQIKVEHYWSPGTSAGWLPSSLWQFHCLGEREAKLCLHLGLVNAHQIVYSEPVHWRLQPRFHCQGTFFDYYFIGNRVCFRPSAKQWARLYGSRLKRELEASTPARSPAKTGYAVRTKDPPLWKLLILCH